MATFVFGGGSERSTAIEDAAAAFPGSRRVRGGRGLQRRRDLPSGAFVGGSRSLDRTEGMRLLLSDQEEGTESKKEEKLKEQEGAEDREKEKRKREGDLGKEEDEEDQKKEKIEREEVVMDSGVHQELPSGEFGEDRGSRDPDSGASVGESRRLDKTKGKGRRLLPSDQKEGKESKPEEKMKEQECAEDREEEKREGDLGKEEERECDLGEEEEKEAKLGGEEEKKEGEEEEDQDKAKRKMEEMEADPDEVQLKSDSNQKLKRTNKNALLVLSGLLVLVMPVVVWSSISQPILIVWRLSLLLCCCSCIWSRTLDESISSRIMLLFFSLSFMLALYADATLDTKMGLLFAHLNSHFAAGMLGYALAEHRQRNGTEVSATVAAAGIPSDQKEADKLLYYQTLGGLYFTVVTLGFAARVAWVVCHRADYSTQDLLLHVPILLAGVLMLWTIFVAGMLLRGALMEETGLCFLVMYLVSVMLLYTIVSIFVGHTGAMVFISHGILGFSAYFGYSLSVYASFKLRLKLAQLQVKTGESKAESSLRSLQKKKPDESFMIPSQELMWKPVTFCLV